MPAQPSDAPETGDTAESPAADPATPEQEPGERPVRVVFRLPMIALLVVFAAELCAIPAAFALPGLQVILLVPLFVGYWVVRNRTTADGERIVARQTFRSVTLPWSELASLRLKERSWVRAVRTDGAEVTLPAVRVRHLPMLARVSGGRLGDPSVSSVRQAKHDRQAEQPPE